MVWNALAQWTLRTPTRSRTHEPRKGSRRLRTHVDVECLEDRLTPSGISGHVFQDVTGNGLTADDTALKGVRVELFRDVNHDGKLDRHDGAPVAVAFSKQDGSYSFSGLSAGTYFVREVLPFHNVRTAPVLSDYYTVNLPAGSTVTGGVASRSFVMILLASAVGMMSSVFASWSVRQGHTHEGLQPCQRLLKARALLFVIQFVIQHGDEVGEHGQKVHAPDLIRRERRFQR